MLSSARLLLKDPHIVKCLYKQIKDNQRGQDKTAKTRNVTQRHTHTNITTHIPTNKQEGL